MFERIFILENRKIIGVEKEKKKIEDLLKSCGKIVEKELKNPDLILTMGGDGTILKAIGLLKNQKTVIYGINYGKIGFLTNSSENIEFKIKKVLEGDFKISERMVLELMIKKNHKTIYKSKVLNDFLIFRKGIRIVEILVYIDGKEVFNFRGDGIIISTPTGSTAHSLSAGGPIICSDMECILLTPLCPYSLNTRSLVIPSDKKIKIKISPEGKIIEDGQRENKIGKGEEIEIEKGKIKAKLIIEEDFFEKLKTKFNFGR
ncbi:MAG: NAD(+)/NADH kinase [Candidatus Omnitrophica bacterium]|nr:NAD(+)/NADH kinase [Candidatus Omnitrophota bacterium]MCM8811082.1 NAD(+)/NADH kinase [Candidatus Omnitrophota bacterium]